MMLKKHLIIFNILYDKNSQKKLGMEGTYLNIIKAIYNRPTGSFILNREKAESLSSKIWNMTRLPTVPTVIQPRTGSPSQSNQTRERNKGHSDGREEAKLSLFADDMIVYSENPIISTQNSLS